MLHRVDRRIPVQVTANSDIEYTFDILSVLSVGEAFLILSKYGIIFQLQCKVAYSLVFFSYGQ